MKERSRRTRLNAPFAICGCVQTKPLDPAPSGRMFRFLIFFFLLASLAPPLTQAVFLLGEKLEALPPRPPFSSQGPCLRDRG